MTSVGCLFVQYRQVDARVPSRHADPALVRRGAQDFVDVNDDDDDPPTEAEIEALQRKLDTLTTEQRAFVDAYLQRLRGREPH